MDLKQTATAILYQQQVDPLSCYCPTPHGLKVHESIASKVLLFWGNGASKTYTSAHEFCLALTGRHWVHYCINCGAVYTKNVGRCKCGTIVIRKYYAPIINQDGEITGSRFKPLDARICAEKDALTGGNETSNAILPLMHRLLAPYLKKGFPKKGGKNYEFKWELTNGAFFDVYVYEQEDKAFESVSKDLIWFDEPFRESIYKASTARMRRGTGGRMIFSLTPLVGAVWMYERFIDVTGADNDDVSVFYAECWDNCKCLTPEEHDFTAGQPLDELGHCTCHNGYVHKKAIERMMQEWEPEERDAREKGQFVTLRDRAFTEFDVNAHVLNEELTPDSPEVKDMQLYVVCDPHIRRPPAWGIYGIDRDNVVYVLEEFPNYYEGMYKDVFYEKIKDYSKGYPDTVKIFHGIEKRWGGRVKRRYIDPRHGSTRLPNTRRMIMDEYRFAAEEQGFDMRFRKAKVGSDSTEGEIASGLTLIKQKLRYNNNKPVDAGNCPGLLVNPKCVNHIRMFQYLRHDTRTGKQAEGKLPSSQLVERFKDFCDVVRYLLKSVDGYERPVVHEDNYVYQPACSLTGY